MTFQGTPEWYGGGKGALKEYIERAEAQSRERYKPYEKNGKPLSRISPFTPLQNKGFQQIESEATNPAYSRLYSQSARNIQNGATPVAPQIQGYLRQGTEAVEPYRDVRNYMNPYTDEVVNKIATLGNRNLRENILPGVQNQFIGAGQYGSTGHQNLTNRAIRNTTEAISQAQGEALQGGYNTALQTALSAQTGQRERALGAGDLAGRVAGRDVEREMASGEALQGLAGQQQMAGLRGGAAMEQAGAQQQAQGQNELNTAYQQFQEERNFPSQQMARYGEELRGLPIQNQLYGSTYTPQPPQPSPWRQGAGLLAGMYGAMNQNQPQQQGYATGGHVRRASHHYRHYAEGGSVNPIQAGVNDAMDTSELQELRGHAQRLKQPVGDPFWSAISRAGFKLASSQNPNAFGALGEAGEQGLNEYQSHMATNEARQLQSAKIMEIIDTTKRLQNENNRKHLLEQDKFGENKRQFGLQHSIEGGKLGLERDKFAYEKEKDKASNFSTYGGEYGKMRLKEEAKADVKRSEEIREKSSKAHENIQRIDQILGNLDEAKIGPGFDARKYISSAAQGMGIDIPELGNPASMLEVKKGLKSLAMEITKNMSVKPTNFDLETAIAALPSEYDSPQAVREVLMTMKKMQQFSYEQDDFKDKWESNYGSIRAKSPNGLSFEKAYRLYADKNIWNSSKKEQ